MNTTHDNTPTTLDLTVMDLYRQLAETRAGEAQDALRLVPARAAVAWGADCLAETVAHLRVYAGRLDPADERREWIDSLVFELLALAAQFELESDRSRSQ